MKEGTSWNLRFWSSEILSLAQNVSLVQEGRSVWADRENLTPCPIPSLCLPKAKKIHKVSTKRLENNKVQPEANLVI